MAVVVATCVGESEKNAEGLENAEGEKNAEEEGEENAEAEEEALENGVTNTEGDGDCTKQEPFVQSAFCKLPPKKTVATAVTRRDMQDMPGYIYHLFFV